MCVCVCICVSVCVCVCVRERGGEETDQVSVNVKFTGLECQNICRIIYVWIYIYIYIYIERERERKIRQTGRQIVTQGER